jgi:hypothetical protein
MSDSLFKVQSVFTDGKAIGRVSNVLASWVEQNTAGSRSRGLIRQHGQCGEKDCLVPTTGRKPFCHKHIDQIPYAAAVKATLQGIEKEIKNLQKQATKTKPRSVIKHDSVVLEDILNYLTYSNLIVSVELLARRLWLPPEATIRYVQHLAWKKQVFVLKTPQGATFVTLRENACLLKREIQAIEKAKAQAKEALRLEKAEEKRLARRAARDKKNAAKKALRAAAKALREESQKAESKAEGEETKLSA